MAGVPPIVAGIPNAACVCVCVVYIHCGTEPVHNYVCVCVCVCIQKYIYIKGGTEPVHDYVCVCLCECIQIYMHTRTYMYVHIYTCTHTCTYIHIDIGAPAPLPPLASPVPRQERPDYSCVQLPSSLFPPAFAPALLVGGFRNPEKCLPTYKSSSPSSFLSLHQRCCSYYGFDSCSYINT